MKPAGNRDAERRVGLARNAVEARLLLPCAGLRVGAFRPGGGKRCPRRNPEFPVQAGDELTVDGQPVRSASRVYLMMNKPRGLVTTASDEKARATVYSLLSPELPWVAPVGRLDQASEGLLLFTNDSEWAARIMSPDSRIEKTYRVQIGAIAEQPLVTKLREGIARRSEHLRAVRVSILRTSQKTSWLEVVLDEGRNRHIRRMLASEGIEVLRLIRIAIGPLALGNLAKGEVRPLTSREKTTLDAPINSANLPLAKKSYPDRA